MIGTGVLAHHQHQLRFVDVLQGNRALADADGLAQPGTAALVAHVAAIGQVVGAVVAHEELIEIGRLIARPTAGVEDGLVRRWQRSQLVTHHAESLVPADGFIV